MNKRENMVMDSQLTLEVECVYGVESCDKRAGFPTVKEKFKEITGIDFPKDQNWDADWDWGDAFGFRKGDWLYVLACDGEDLYKIHGVAPDSSV